MDQFDYLFILEAYRQRLGSREGQVTVVELEFRVRAANWEVAFEVAHS